jgi:hypothetical protein
MLSAAVASNLIKPVRQRELAMKINSLFPAAKTKEIGNLGMKEASVRSAVIHPMFTVSGSVERSHNGIL